MYTKSQFNRLLKTRKYWTGKQLGRMLVQTTIEQMNGKKPFVDPYKDLGPLISNLANPEDIRVYDSYANLCTAIDSAWNFTEAIGNDAIANLRFIRSIVAHLTDWANAEINNQSRPAMITQKQYEQYKDQYKDLIAKRRKKAEIGKENLITVLMTVDDDRPYYQEKGIRKFGPHATKVIDSYKDKRFNSEELAFLRNIIQKNNIHERDNKKAKKIDEIDCIQIEDGFYDLQCYLTAPEKFPLDKDVKLYFDSLYGLTDNTSDKEKIKTYVDQIEHEQLQILLRRKKTYSEALIEAIKKRPFSSKVARTLNPMPNNQGPQTKTVPYIPDNLTYADLFWVSEKTGYIAYLFWENIENYTVRTRLNGEIEQANNFILSHFSDFVDAIKKDLIDHYPKLDKVFNEVPNSTSLIIPQITYKTLATAGLESYQDLIEEIAHDDGVEDGITTVFPERIRESARINGFAVLVPESRYHFTDKHNILYDSDETIVAQNQHYDIKNFVIDTLNAPETKERIGDAVSSIDYYITGQASYKDLIKGVSRFANSKGLRKYDHTDALNKFAKAIADYEKELLNLFYRLALVLSEDYEGQLAVNKSIRRVMPRISLENKKFKHKTIPELVDLIKANYLNRTAPESVFSIINQIAEGAQNNG